MKGVSSVKELTLLMPEEQAALEDFLTRLSSRFKRRVLQVILFGSRARGEGDVESDLDVLIVLDNVDWRFHDEVALESFDPSLRFGVLISPITMPEEDYDWHKAHRAPLYRQIERDGVELWTMMSAPS